ncbi:unnamed protein product, partial [Linum tenue]
FEAVEGRDLVVEVAHGLHQKIAEEVEEKGRREVTIYGENVGAMKETRIGQLPGSMLSLIIYRKKWRV